MKLKDQKMTVTYASLLLHVFLVLLTFSIAASLGTVQEAFHMLSHVSLVPIVPYKTHAITPCFPKPTQVSHIIRTVQRLATSNKNLTDHATLHPSILKLADSQP
jgi:hypothetical protein